MSVKSSTGYQLERAELLSQDADGNPIKHRPRGDYEVPVKETRATPNSTHGLEDKQAASKVLHELEPDELAVLNLQQEVKWELKQFTIAASKLEEALRNGYAFIRHDQRGRAVVDKQFPVSLTYVEIGERLGLTANRVHHLVKSANKKLRAKR